MQKKSHLNALGSKFDLDVGQGQPRIIISTNLVGPISQMLHSKSQVHQPSGFEEEDFKKFFYHIWVSQPS